MSTPVAASAYKEVILFLATAGIVVPLFTRLRVSPVLGFIGAGAQFWGAKKEAIGFAATTSIKRSDFGMGFDVPLVSDKVDLVINAGFEAE